MSLTADDLHEYASKKKTEMQENDDGIIRYNGDFIEDLLAISQDFENQYKRRAAIKSASAVFESIVFELWEQLKKYRSISEAARIILYGKTLSLADNGRIKERKTIYPLKIRLRFALNEFNKLYDIDKKCILTEKLWKDIDSFLHVRNKLLHPDDISILKVGDSEIRLAMELADNMFTLLVLNMNVISIGIAKWKGQDQPDQLRHPIYLIAESNFNSAKEYLFQAGIFQ
ncbi:MAG: hypothetical protein V4654_02525 [Bdellovibrionota bacterium]